MTLSVLVLQNCSEVTEAVLVLFIQSVHSSSGTRVPAHKCSLKSRRGMRRRIRTTRTVLRRIRRNRIVMFDQEKKTQENSRRRWRPEEKSPSSQSNSVQVETQSLCIRLAVCVLLILAKWVYTAVLVYVQCNAVKSWSFCCIHGELDHEKTSLLLQMKYTVVPDLDVGTSRSRFKTSTTTLR